MTRLEFVSTEDSTVEFVIPLSVERFTLGTDAGCELVLPAQTPEPVKVSGRLAADSVALVLEQGSMSLDGRPATQVRVGLGQVVRLGGLGLLLRRENVEEHTRRAKVPVLERTVQSAMLAPGTVVSGRYEIVGRLGSGAMGDVYQAEHTRLHRPFALKVMKKELASDPEFVARFEREAIATTRIRHRNIVDVIDFGQTDAGHFYFVMEFIEGQTLGTLLHRSGALAAHRVLRIALQIGRALTASHAEGVVHRDLKPENIMVLEGAAEPDEIKVLDFGVAKVAGAASGASQTAVGMVVGTPQYMAPEQAFGQPADQRTDIYSLGLLIHEMCTGKPVFEGDSASDLLMKQTSEQAPPFEPGPMGDVPKGLEDLVLKMLAKRPVARPQTMTEVVAELELLAVQLQAPAHSPSPRDEQRTEQLPVPMPSPAAVAATRIVARVPAEPSDSQLARTVQRKPGPAVAIGAAVILALAVGAFLALRPSASPQAVTSSTTTPPVTAREVPAPGIPTERAAAPAPAETPPVAAPATNVTIETDPPAALTIDGALRGTGRVEWPLPAEGQEVAVLATAAGYQPAKLSLTSRSPASVKLKLTRLKSTTGDLADPFEPSAGGVADPWAKEHR